MQMIDPTTLALVGRALDVATLRQAVHAQNIANANVEGYLPSSVRFEEHLGHVRAALSDRQPVQPRDLEVLQPSVVAAALGSKVELDMEVSALARNSMHYQALVKVLDREMSLMSLAVSDGKR
ncbi:flagellar basal body rod protein FlgB [Paucibacter sp. KBW04]|uniref:flagellar basal body rod protein FlgB n=1 Tax=Paucibacter sp. KBW04 TaxID=2153361 RepID=UPI000F57913A|nr:flagellar basal body rod protein FlgB [Paucibacter sp. KBW04]RQO63591.1 flagellar basal body rod protein FlgB [Paucibacter sp. KBW04]